MNAQLKATIARFFKVIIAAGIAGASTATLVALQVPNATGAVVALAAANGFIAAVLLAAEKYLTFTPPVADPSDPGFPPA